MKTKDLIDGFKATSFYILDTTQDGLSSKIIPGSGDINYTRYCFNTHKYGKLEAGGVFLYRQTKRSSQTRKFYFFGGGVIKDIVSVSNDGRSKTSIESGFRLVQPVYEDNPKLDSMTWTTKKKVPGSWDHFFNQYGMNKITEQEFLSIIDKTDYVPVNSDTGNIAIDEMEEERKPIDKASKELENFVGEYTHNKVREDKMQAPAKTKRGSVAKKTDFDVLNAKKKTVGTFGEMLIYNDEVKKTGDFSIKGEVVHASIKEGDGLGYDIRSFNEKGEKVFIEVKTTESDSIDKFYLTPNEIEVAHKEPNFKLYRVYDLDMVSGTYKVEIYTAVELFEKFDLHPASYVAVRK